MITDIGLGITYFARGFKLIRKPEIRAYVLMPILINFVLFGGLIWLGYAQFSPLVEWMMSLYTGVSRFSALDYLVFDHHFECDYCVFYLHTSRQYRRGAL